MKIGKFRMIRSVVMNFSILSLLPIFAQRRQAVPATNLTLWGERQKPKHNFVINNRSGVCHSSMQFAVSA
jgi:hypothetical protein